MEPTERLAYLAGFFDGEGYIGAVERTNRSGRKSYNIEIAVTQVLKEPLELFRQAFGGIVQWNRLGWYQWRAYSKVASKALYEMLPWLGNKQMQARVALQLDSMLIAGRKGLSKEVSGDELSIRHNLATRLRSLKDESTKLVALRQS